MKHLFFSVILFFLSMFVSCTQVSFLENEADENDKNETDKTLQIVDFSITGSDTLTIPLNEEGSASVTLYNNADDKDSYSISTDCEFAEVKLSRKSVTLNGKSHITIEITAKVTEEKDATVKIIFQSKNNPEIKREHLIKVNTVDNDFSVQSDVSYYAKGIESQIKVTLTNKTSHHELIYLRFDKVPSFVRLRRMPMLVPMTPREKVTLSFPYTVNIDCDDKIAFDFLVYSGNGKRLRQTKEITLWDLTSYLVNLANKEETKEHVDLADDAKKLQEKFRENDYIQANEIAMQMVSKLADFAGVEQTEPENDMYFIDADEPEVRIEVPQTPSIFSQNIGEFKIIAAENPVSGACSQSGESHSNNLFYIDETAYYLQKNGQLYIPTKKFVKGVPLLKNDGSEQCTTYFRYKKTVTVNMKSHTTSGNSSGYEYEQFREDQKKATAGYWAITVSSQKDSSGVITSCTYKLYSPESAVCFEVTEEADDSREFLSELDNVPTDRIVIFTHGTLFYKWVTEAKQHGDYYMFCEDGEGNTAKFFKQPSVAQALNLDYSRNDKAYYFNWSGENNYDHRDKAAVALEKFIYSKVAANLFNCRASQIVLIGHSHGVTVNNITMHNLQTDKMEKFAGEIPFVVGLNGIGTSTADNIEHQSGVNALTFFGSGLFPPEVTFGISYIINTSNNEKSNRDCFKFLDKTFDSLDGDKKVKMYNFYSDQDEVVPPAFDDTIILPYNRQAEYVAHKVLAISFPPLSYIFGLTQLIRLACIGVTKAVHVNYRAGALEVDNTINTLYNSSETKSFYLENMLFFNAVNFTDMGFAIALDPQVFAVMMNLISNAPGLFVNPAIALETVANLIGVVLSGQTTLAFVPNIFLLLGVNGIYEHQKTRISEGLIDCLGKIPTEILTDKTVDWRQE